VLRKEVSSINYFAVTNEICRFATDPTYVLSSVCGINNLPYHSLTLLTKNLKDPMGVLCNHHLSGWLVGWMVGHNLLLRDLCDNIYECVCCNCCHVKVKVSL
jgi:hypothetical protein